MIASAEKLPDSFHRQTGDVTDALSSVGREIANSAVCVAVTLFTGVGV
jgi:hypothetical protein